MNFSIFGTPADWGVCIWRNGICKMWKSMERIDLISYFLSQKNFPRTTCSTEMADHFLESISHEKYEFMSLEGVIII